MRHYDCIVIGTGPAGQKGAIQAAKLGKRVAVIEKNKVLGGAQINTGTIPSKALREAVINLTDDNGRWQRDPERRASRRVAISDLLSYSQNVIRHERNIIHEQFDRNGIDLIWGQAHFADTHKLAVATENGDAVISADKFLLAVGTKPARPESVPFNETTIFTSDCITQMNAIPRSMIVVGGGVIGTEFACIMAALGVRVTLVEGRSRVLGFLDHEIADSFQYFMRKRGITLRLGERVESIEEVEVANGTTRKLVQATLESGKVLRSETLLYAVGRQGVCASLALENVGIGYDDRERLSVNERYQTSAEHVYAAGDVIGFPALASTSMEQGRRAICHAFGEDVGDYNTALFPYGIYSIPEMSMVGMTEEQLTEQGIPFESGIADYTEIARGQLLGDQCGMLKLLIHQDTHRILGVHVIGTGATELIHIGQVVMAMDGTAEFFINNVFNFPTLAECYKVAAYNGLNKLNHVCGYSALSEC